jgi:beta-glucanase (GH16 family)
MKTIATLFMVFGILLCSKLNAQYLLLDDMEGHGPCSGKWTYYAGGANATGKVEFGVPNPNPSGLNTSALVAKFTKDTSCFEYMSAGVNMAEPFDLSSSSQFKMLVYSSTTDEIMFKLQPGNDYNKAVFFTYKVSRVNHWEEATYNFQSVKDRTDFNRVEVHFIDGKKANGILYFDLVQAPNPVTITLADTSIAMGQENGAVIKAQLNAAVFKPVLNAAHWTALNLPPGVSIDSVHRENDTTAYITLSGNSAAVYSRAVLQIQVDSQEVANANTPRYLTKGKVVFEGNPAWTLVYGDEFNTNGLPDRSKWTVDPKPKGWINGEQQVYTDTTHDNIRVKDGNLVIKGKKDFPNGTTTEPWSSGRLISQNKMDLLYGRVEVRAKLPKARGSWPAIWMMPTTSAYGGWPKSGEIDIMEHVGNNLGNVLSTVHTQNNNWQNGGHLSGSKKIPDVATAFHVYAVEWTPDSLRFTYDSNHVYTYVNPYTDWKDWPFDQKFHIILNVAIGGGMGGSIVEADWPDSMMVDYVRVYQKGLGTPVLDSILVTPADVSFLPGKTQQYKAIAYDQNGHTMTINPVWSISGAGNTITTDGLATIQSSGVITATATVDSVSVSGTAFATVRPTNYKPIPAKIEAEHFDNSNSCCTEPTSDVGGGRNVSYIGGNTWFEYDITVPDSGNYRIQFRTAMNNATSLRVMLDSVTLTTVPLPSSGGWQKWITVTSAPINFSAGNKTIRIQSNASGWNFNWLRFVRADSVALSRVVVTPDSVRLISGNTQQYKAVAYGQDSSVMSVTPVWATTLTSSTISTSGLFTAGNVSTTTTGAVTATADGVTGSVLVTVRPAPVLTRMVIAPDTVTVPVNASQQFTVTGYDQVDSLMAISPLWTVSDTTAAITQTGVFTAGNAAGNVNVTASVGNISATATVTMAFTCTVNEKYEAESCSGRSTRPTLQTCTDIGGGQNFTGIWGGDYFRYSTLNVPVAGRYNIRFRVSTTAPARIWVGHGGMNFGTVELPNTKGAWQTISDTMTLPALSYTGIHSESGTFKFNWFIIDNCAEDTSASLARMAVSHEKIQQPEEKVAAVVYPNPTAGQVTVDIPEHSYNTMILLNMDGKVIRRWYIAPADRKVVKDVGFLQSGMYLIRLEGNKGTQTLKLMKGE